MATLSLGRRRYGLGGTQGDDWFSAHGEDGGRFRTLLFRSKRMGVKEKTSVRGRREGGGGLQAQLDEGVFVGRGA